MSKIKSKEWKKREKKKRRAFLSGYRIKIPLSNNTYHYYAESIEHIPNAYTLY